MAQLQQPISLVSATPPWPSSTSSQWHQSLCLAPEDRVRRGYTSPRGHLSDNPGLDAVLWNFLLFGPAVVLLIVAPFRIFNLYRAKLVTAPNYRGLFKAIAIITLFTLQLAHVITGLDVAGERLTSDDSILIEEVLGLLASAALCVLSFLEHGRSVAPSTTLTVYLVFLVICGTTRVGLLFVAKNLCGYSLLVGALLVTELLVLILELQDKTGILREPYRDLAPEERSGFLSNAVFGWVNHFIALGYSKILSPHDMPPLASFLDTMTVREAMQRTWDGRRRPDGRWSLIRAVFGCLWRPNLDIIIPRLLFTMFRYCQPLLISRAIAYVSSSLPAFEDRNEAFRLILFALIIYTGMAIFNGMYDVRMNRLTIMIKMGVVGLIHNRCLTIRDGVFDDSAAVTLMSNDADSIRYSVELVHELWAQLLELLIGMYLLAAELGWVCLVPLFIVVGTSQGSRFVTQNITSRQKALSMATQTRISVIKAILDSMKNIKMMGLVDKMESKIQAARDTEINAYIGFGWLIVAFNASAHILNLFSPVFTLILYAVQAQLRGTKAIDVNTAFTSLAVLSMVTMPANMILVLIPNIATALAAFSRIQKYLLSPDREDKRQFSNKRYSDRANRNPDRQPSTFPGGQASSTASTETLNTMDDHENSAISLQDVTVRPASTADPVLNNISTLFNKDSLVVCSGAVGTGKTTLAKALLGDLPPDSGVIKTAFGAISYCSQSAWLRNGTIKDNIRGPPDNHSEFDEAWYSRVLHSCGLVEDLNQLPDGDQTVVGSRGVTLSGGQKQRVALARAVYARRSMIILDDVLSALDATTECHIVDNLIGPKGLFRELGTTVFLITHATQHLPLADYIIILGEDGKIVEQGSWDKLRAEVGYISKVVLKEKEGSQADFSDTSRARESIQKPPAKIPKEELEDLTRKAGDITLYSYYFGAIGSAKLLTLLCSMSSYALFLGLSPYWLKWWAESGGERIWYYSTIYFVFSLCSFVFIMMTVANLLIVIAPRSGNTLHARLLRTVMGAPQPYFDLTDTGTTLNRFSADTFMMDRRLPMALMAVGQSFFRLLSQCILLGVVQPLMTMTLPFTFIIVFFIQKLYLATSRQLRLMDLESREAVNTNFLETLEGVATIRAFGWQRPFINDNVRKLDLHLRPSYMLSALQRWLTIVLDFIVLGLAMLVITLAVVLKGTTTGGQIGIALNVVIQANMSLLRLVESYTSMETSLGAISRLRSFEKEVQPEDKPGETREPAQTWPERGAIDFDHMSAAYNPSTLAIRDMSVTIEPGKKVGVCGRTGAGKSSLLLSLLRLIEIESGTIRIDDLDVQTLSRNAIRSRIITVPQDPMLVMTDTVRENLDITESAASDDDIIQALERVKLWSVLQARTTSTAEAGRQDRELEAAMGGGSGGGDGSNNGSSSSSAQHSQPTISAATADTTNTEAKPAMSLPSQSQSEPQTQPDSATANLNAMMKSLALSHGQQQLFSLARAMLMRPTRGKVVLLDEATSNVDQETNNLMQRLIRDEFREHTIITVAHRLDTIMDSDVVLVLDGGRLVEVGPPGELVQKEGGVFRGLYGSK